MWSEQVPQDWSAALIQAMDALAAHSIWGMATVIAIDLSGRQHGAVLPGTQGTALRPCILWNDECAARKYVEIAHRFPGSRLNRAGDDGDLFD
ncbi:hypothetical protein MSKU15_0190 [Komagataeibacter diospyri]|uniref:hypothetical protein n=1 Tax=Komagataeibacter diospyri TaxID=1932662 RepID=UPI00113AD16C|nr:hypothetical protein [Komagataeibacter diospyri]GCE88589.1 hypothetical protein MSKU15_0190 [Komagataeibacter diospyri]